MKSQKGVTLIFLVVTVVILLILAGITITSSINMYRKMQYENFLAQLEELQSAVDKMCEKYKTGEFTSYSDATTGFFASVYGEIPGTLAVAENASNAEYIIDNYFGGNASFHEGYVFYFYSSQLQDYFNINGIEFDVVIDFSTRYVYSVDGCSDYTEDEVIYSLIDLEDSKVIQKSSASVLSNSSGITFTQVPVQSDSTKMYKITLVLNYSDDIGKYNIDKAYFSTNEGAQWVDVSYLGDCEYTENTVSFYVYDSGTYYFKIQDTSGKVISNLQDSTDSVYTTINF